MGKSSVVLCWLLLLLLLLKTCFRIWRFIRPICQWIFLFENNNN